MEKEKPGFKEQLKELTRKVDKLKDEKLNMEVYLRQESHCFYGTEGLTRVAAMKTRDKL